jgi:hypothetical protein
VFMAGNYVSLQKGTVNMGLSYKVVFLILFCVVWISVVLYRLSFVIDTGDYSNKVEKASCPKGQVCLERGDYDVLVKQAVGGTTFSNTRERDIRVLKDPLYPGLNRTDAHSFEGVAQMTKAREINVPTHGYYDSFRLIGYLSNEDDRVGNYKIMGRMKDRNRGEFYLVPVDRTLDMKIQVTDEMMKGERLRDVDTLPGEITFDSPLLSKTPYKVTELPKGELGSEFL